MDKNAMPNIPNARTLFDFSLIPSLVHSADFTDFLVALIKSEGEVLAEIMNDTYQGVAAEQGIELETDHVFSKEDFHVITGKVDDQTGMTIVDMPADAYSERYCSIYVLVYDTDMHTRFFVVSKTTAPTPDTRLEEITGENECVDHGPMEEPTVRKAMEKVLQIINR